MSIVTIPGFIGPASVSCGSNPNIAAQTVSSAPSPSFCWCIQITCILSLPLVHDDCSVPIPTNEPVSFEVQLVGLSPPTERTRTVKDGKNNDQWSKKCEHRTQCRGTPEKIRLTREEQWQLPGQGMRKQRQEATSRQQEWALTLFTLGFCLTVATETREKKRISCVLWRSSASGQLHQAVSVFFPITVHWTCILAYLLCTVFSLSVCSVIPHLYCIFSECFSCLCSFFLRYFSLDVLCLHLSIFPFPASLQHLLQEHFNY